jgi:hypothetical protein
MHRKSKQARRGRTASAAGTRPASQPGDRPRGADRVSPDGPDSRHTANGSRPSSPPRVNWARRSFSVVGQIVRVAVLAVWVATLATWVASRRVTLMLGHAGGTMRLPGRRRNRPGVGKPQRIGGGRRKPELATYFRSQASWRESLAEEHPEDPRHANSAEALLALAAHVEELPADDRRVRYLSRHLRNDQGGFSGLATFHAVSRWGLRETPNRRASTPNARDEFLNKLCALAARDAYEFVCEMAKDFSQTSPAEIAWLFGLTMSDARAALSNETKPTSHFLSTYGMDDRRKDARDSKPTGAPKRATAVRENVTEEHTR